MPNRDPPIIPSGPNMNSPSTLPLRQAPDGMWLLELAPMADRKVKVDVEEFGGLMRIQGVAVMRRRKETREPITATLRLEDANPLGFKISSEFVGSHRW